MRSIFAGALLALIPTFALADPIKLCTGSPEGVYYAAGLEIQKMAGRTVEIEVVTSEGAIDSIERVLDLAATDPEACDAMIGQGDGPTYLARKTPAAAKKLRLVAPLHDEYAHFLCNRKSGITDIEKLLDNPAAYSVAIGPAGSGGWLLWQNFIAEKPAYGKVQPTTDTGPLALSAVAAGDTTCMLVVAGLGHGTITEADNVYGDNIALVEATDWSFNNAKDLKGEPLYTFADIPSKTYPKSLQTGMWSGVETVKMPAAVFINPDRIPADVLPAFITTANRAAIGIKAQFNK